MAIHAGSPWHNQLREAANAELYGGWPMVRSGLQTLLETGEMLTTPGSLQYLSCRNNFDRGAAFKRLDRHERILEELTTALIVQFQRTAAIQAQLDLLLATLKRSG